MNRRGRATYWVMMLTAVVTGCAHRREVSVCERMPFGTHIEIIPTYGLLKTGVFGIMESASGFPVEAFRKTHVIIGEDREGYVTHKIVSMQDLAGAVRIENERDALTFVRLLSNKKTHYCPDESQLELAPTRAMRAGSHALLTWALLEVPDAW